MKVLKATMWLATILMYGGQILAVPQTTTVYVRVKVDSALQSTLPDAVAKFKADLAAALAKATFFAWKPASGDATVRPELTVTLGFDDDGGVVIGGSLDRAANLRIIDLPTGRVFTQSDYINKDYENTTSWPDSTAMNQSFTKKLGPVAASFFRETLLPTVTDLIPISEKMNPKAPREVVVPVPYSTVVSKILKAEAQRAAVPLPPLRLTVRGPTGDGAASTYPQLGMAELSDQQWSSLKSKALKDAVYIDYGNNRWDELLTPFDLIR